MEKYLINCIFTFLVSSWPGLQKVSVRFKIRRCCFHHSTTEALRMSLPLSPLPAAPIPQASSNSTSHQHSYTRIEELAEWFSGKGSSCQCRRPGFDPWVGKMPWRRKWQSSILAWKILWTEKPGGLQSMELQKSRT